MPGDISLYFTLFCHGNGHAAADRLQLPEVGCVRRTAPLAAELAADRPDVTVAKVDVDENMSLAAAYGVESIPMLLVFKNGQLVNKSIGFVSQPEIEKLLQ